MRSTLGNHSKAGLELGLKKQGRGTPKCSGREPVRIGPFSFDADSFLPYYS